MQKLLILLFCATLWVQATQLPTRLPIILDHKAYMILLDPQKKMLPNQTPFQFIYQFKQTPKAWVAVAQSLDNTWGYINHHGKWISKHRFDIAKGFSKDNIARVKQHKKWGFLKTDGTFLITPKFHYVTPFYQGLAAVQEKKESLYYYINTKGQKVFQQHFTHAKTFAANGLAAVATSESINAYDVTPQGVKKYQIRGKATWGYIDTTGKMVIKPQFKRTGTFNLFNIAPVRDNANNSKLINTQGEYVSDTTYEYLWRFSPSGVAWSKSKGDKPFEGYINTEGQPVWKASYHDFKGEYNNLLVKHRGNFQVFDPFGNLVIKEKSTWMDSFQDPNVSIALRKNRWGVISKESRFTPFPDDIIAPLTNNEHSVVGFIDGLVAMINDKREILYFDTTASLQYKLTHNSDNFMTLYDTNHTTIWQSTLPKQKAYPFLARGDQEFLGTQEYNTTLHTTLKTLLKAKPRKYHIPNPLYQDSSNPYDINQDVDRLKKGAIHIIAQGYVSEEAWGEYYFLNHENHLFKRYYLNSKKRITEKYGQPIYDTYNKTEWNILGKRVTLSHLNDYGDGDFYNQLILEVQQGE